MTARLWRCAWLLGLAGLLLPPAGLAAPPAAAGLAARLAAERPWPRLDWMRVEINEAEVSQAVLIMRPRPGAGLWVARDDLQAWRLRPRPSATFQLDGAGYVPLAAVMELTYEVDRSAQVLRVRVPAAAFTATRVSPGERHGPELTAGAAGGYLNYEIAQRRLRGEGTRFGTVEVAHFNRWGLGLSSAVYGVGDRGDDTLRLETAWLHDRPETATRLRLGDGISRGGLLGQDTRFGGIQFGRDFGLQPQRRTFPVPSLAGEAAVASTVDLIINGQRRQQATVPAGPFEFDSPPVVAGAGEAVIQVTDVLGRERTITESFYVEPDLLRPGLTDYSLALGARRHRFGQVSDDYRGLLLNGLIRRGITDQLTGELHGEWQDGLYLAGGGATLVPGLPISLDLGLGVAGYDGANGWLGEFDARHSGRRFSAGLRVSMSDDALAGAVADGRLLRAKRDVILTAGRRFGRNGISGLVIERKPFQGPDFRLADLGVTRSMAWGGLVRLSVFRREFLGTGSREEGMQLLLSLPLGGRTNITGITESVSGGERQSTLQLQRSLPFGTGAGYRLRHEDNGVATRTAAEYLGRGSAGSYRLEVADSDAGTAYEAGLSGAVGWIDGSPFATRRIDQSFALVRVPGLGGVEIYQENQLVAVTTNDGSAVIPNLRAYQTNRLRLEVDDLPLDAGVTSLEREAVPRFRSGTVIDFPVRRVRGAAFRLVRAHGEPVPAAAAIRGGHTDRVFRVGRNGRAYVEELGPGVNRFTARWPDGRCVFDVTLPAEAVTLPELGDIPCISVGSGGG